MVAHTVLGILSLGLCLIPGLVEVEGQAKAGEWEKYKSNPEYFLSAPVLPNVNNEKRDSTSTKETFIKFWDAGNAGVFHQDYTENNFIPFSNDFLNLGPLLFGNPAFFCIDIPKMMHESSVLEMGKDPNTGRDTVIFQPPKKREKIDKFNQEGVGWNTQQRRSKARFINPYSLFWIMEPTSFRWNRRFVFRKNAAKLENLKPEDLGWSIRDWPRLSARPKMANPEYDAYTDIAGGGIAKWKAVTEKERQRVENEGLYWHVEVTGIRNPDSKKVLKGWYHAKITLRLQSDGTKPVSKSKYVIDRLAVSARGLTVNHDFSNTGPFFSFQGDYQGNLQSYLSHGKKFLNNRPHRVWEGGAGEFVQDFPKCKGVNEHKPRYFSERQFVPCGTTAKSQWYYGNNFIYVKTDYAEYPDKDQIYGGGVVYNGDHEEIHLNYKLDQSFCNLYFAFDFVVNGVVIKGDKFQEVVKMDSRGWIDSGTDHSFAVERSSSTRIVFIPDTYVNDQKDLDPTCQAGKLYMKAEPPIIKGGNLSALNFYETADPIPNPSEKVELDCFVSLKEFDNATDKHPEESFGGAIQEIIITEDFSKPAQRGLTLSYWYLYLHAIPGNCGGLGCGGGPTEFSTLISEQVKEWNWFKDEPSDINKDDAERVYERTRLPYFDGTMKSAWLSYYDWVGDGLKDIYRFPRLNASIMRLGEDLACPVPRMLSIYDDVWEDVNWLRVNTYFLWLYFKGVPFMGRGSADRSHQAVANGFGHYGAGYKDFERQPFSGEPGHSPTACDRYVSRHLLRILDPEDDEAYLKAVGEPNDPTNKCYDKAARLTTDPALQYIRKVYVKPRSQPKDRFSGNSPQPLRSKTWIETYLNNNSAVLFCETALAMEKILGRGCPTMIPKPYTPMPPSKEPEKRTTTPAPPVNDEYGRRVNIPPALYVWDSRVLHGIWMTILTVFVIPVSVFLARFYKETFMSERDYLNRVWYYVHIMSSLCTFALILVGLTRQSRSSRVLGKSWTTTALFHRGAGFLTVLVLFWITVMGGFRALNKTIRCCSIFTHWFLGTLAYVLLLLCMLSSVGIPASPSSYIDYSTTPFSVGNIFPQEVTLCLIIYWILFDISMQIFMTVKGCDTDKEMKITPRRLYVPVPIPVLPEHFRYDSPGHDFRVRCLISYVTMSILCTTVICVNLVLVDPQTDPPRGLGQMWCTHNSDGTIRESWPKYCPLVSW